MPCRRRLLPLADEAGEMRADEAAGVFRYHLCHVSRPGKGGDDLFPNGHGGSSQYHQEAYYYYYSAPFI